MAPTSTDAPAPPVIRCGFCGADSAPDRPLTAFWVAPFSYNVLGVERRHDKRARHLACPTCWTLVRARNSVALAARSVAADQAEGREGSTLKRYAQALRRARQPYRPDGNLAGYTAAYVELVGAVENRGGA